MTVGLRAITRENWYQCTQLQLQSDQQDFVAPVAFSLAQSRFEPERVPLAIYDDHMLVGFVMYYEGHFAARLTANAISSSFPAVKLPSGIVSVSSRPRRVS